MNTKEAMQALLDGKKIEVLGAEGYLYISGSGDIRWENGNIASLMAAYIYEIYEEPKKKKQVWQWRYVPLCGTYWQVCPSLLDEIEANGYFKVNDAYEIHAGPFEVDE